MRRKFNLQTDDNHQQLENRFDYRIWLGAFAALGIIYLIVLGFTLIH